MKRVVPGLFGLLQVHLAHGEGRPLLVTPEGAYSSRDVELASARVAGWLRGAGLQRGDRVVIDLENGLEAVAALFGAARVGAIVVGATPQWSATQLHHVIGDAGARFLVTDDVRVEQLGVARPPHILVAQPSCAGATGWSDLTESFDGYETVEARAPALIIYTSGTTGAPKGVVHPHKNLVDFGRIAAGFLENTAEDRLLWLLGWSSGYGLSQLLTMCFVGGRLVVPESMLAADVVRAHDAHAATGIAHVPNGWEQLVAFLEKTERTLDGVRYVTNAGDGPSRRLLDRLPRALPGARIVLMYGQTEGLRTTWLPHTRFAEKRGAMGWPIPGVDVHVLGASGALAGVDEPGELLHRGALLSPGYWRAPEATAQKLRPEPALRALIGDEPVLHTGDVVRRDADGCLWYVARSERMIKSSGFRFCPSEIESAVHGLPDIRDVIAFGVDDAALGQAVELAVVPMAASPGGVMDAGPILLALERRLPRYMLPRRVHVLSELPRTPSGKVSMPALRAHAQ